MEKQDRIDLIEKHIGPLREEIIEFLSEIKAERWIEDETDDPYSTFHSIKDIIANGRIGLCDYSDEYLAKTLHMYLSEFSEKEIAEHLLGDDPKSKNLTILFYLSIMYDCDLYYVSGIII